MTGDLLIRNNLDGGAKSEGTERFGVGFGHLPTSVRPTIEALEPGLFDLFFRRTLDNLHGEVETTWRISRTISFSS